MVKSSAALPSKQNSLLTTQQIQAGCRADVSAKTIRLDVDRFWTFQTEALKQIKLRVYLSAPASYAGKIVNIVNTARS